MREPRPPSFSGSRARASRTLLAQVAGLNMVAGLRCCGARRGCGTVGRARPVGSCVVSLCLSAHAPGHPLQFSAETHTSCLTAWPWVYLFLSWLGRAYNILYTSGCRGTGHTSIRYSAPGPGSHQKSKMPSGECGVSDQLADRRANRGIARPWQRASLEDFCSAVHGARFLAKRSARTTFLLDRLSFENLNTFNSISTPLSAIAYHSGGISSLGRGARPSLYTRNRRAITSTRSLCSARLSPSSESPVTCSYHTVRSLWKASLPLELLVSAP